MKHYILKFDKYLSYSVYVFNYNLFTSLPNILMCTKFIQSICWRMHINSNWIPSRCSLRKILKAAYRHPLALSVSRCRHRRQQHSPFFSFPIFELRKKRRLWWRTDFWSNTKQFFFRPFALDLIWLEYFFELALRLNVYLWEYILSSDMFRLEMGGNRRRARMSRKSTGTQFYANKQTNRAE